VGGEEGSEPVEYRLRKPERILGKRDG